MVNLVVKNALNVAISRCKEKLVVFKSLLAKDVKSSNSESVEVFQRWLSYLDLKSDDQKSYSVQVENNIADKLESGFEDAVVEKINENT